MVSPFIYNIIMQVIRFQNISIYTKDINRNKIKNCTLFRCFRYRKTSINRISAGALYVPAVNWRV